MPENAFLPNCLSLKPFDWLDGRFGRLIVGPAGPDGSSQSYHSPAGFLRRHQLSWSGDSKRERRRRLLLTNYYYSTPYDTIIMMVMGDTATTRFDGSPFQVPPRLTHLRLSAALEGSRSL